MRAKAEKGQAQRIGPVHSSRIESYYYVLLCILHVAQLRPVFNVISSRKKRSLFISRVPLPFSLLLFARKKFIKLRFLFEFFWLLTFRQNSKLYIFLIIIINLGIFLYFLFQNITSIRYINSSLENCSFVPIPFFAIERLGGRADSSGEMA